MTSSATRTRSLIVALCAAAASCASLSAQTPLSTAFTYQGELSLSGSPASGPHDVRFRLYDAASGGSQIGATLCLNDLSIAGGRFAASLDFGTVFSGQRRFIEIEVRPDTGLDCADASAFTLLTPRQELTAAPAAAFALVADTATNAGALNGQPADFYQNSTNLTGTLPSARLSGSYTSALTLNSPANLFAGNGAALTGLSAGNISTGLLAAARMPADWVAGGDLSGVYPSPTIGPAAVTLGKLAPNLQTVLSNLTGVPLAPTPRDALGWGSNADGQTNIPALPAGVIYTALAAGHMHNLALRSDGNIVGWGRSAEGQTSVPALPGGVTYTRLAAGGAHSLAVRSNGTVAAWGSNVSGQIIVPSLPAGVTYTAVAGGTGHSLAVRSNGTAVAWGNNEYGQTVVPALPAGVTYTAVAGGENYSLARRSDGTIVVWGNNTDGTTSVPALPAGVSYTDIAAGRFHSVALRSDGTAVAWGHNNFGQLNLPALPPGVTYTAVSAREFQSLLLRSDGAVVALGWNAYGQMNVPALPAGTVYTAVAAGSGHSIALRGNSFAPVVSSAGGLSVGSTILPPALGGIAVAGNSSFAGNVGIGTATPVVALDVGLNRVIGTSATDPSGQHGAANRGVKASFGAVLSNAPAEFVGMRTVVAAGTNGCGNTADVTFSTWECITSGSREVVRINGRGNMLVSGSISKGGGSFKIDHPLDPENKFLYHSFVESPDMMNIYNGNVTTDDKGYATITLPDYFEALNRDFRYSVTVVDEVDADEVFLWAKVVRKVSGNQFTVRSSRGELEVSWQVTGVRKDAWAEKNRIPNSVDKAGEERGTLLHPDAFVAAPGKGVAATSELAAPVATDK